MSDEPVKRKLTITSCDEITRGQGKKGEWVLYNVAAVDESGAPVDAELRAFDQLPLGELLEFEVVRKEHEKYGVSFTLSRPKGRLGPKVDELRRELDELKERVARLEQGFKSEATPAATADEEIPF